MTSPLPLLLLDAWEHGRGLPPARRALLLLAAGGPDAPAGLTAGQRDARLLELRRRAFGSRLVALADCPRCGERLELAFPVEDVLSDAVPAPPAELALDLDGWAVRFRLPAAIDLADAADRGDAAAARQLLLERCVLAARRGDRELTAGELPEPVVAAVAGRMAEADPRADIRLDLACPGCGHGWQAPLDVVAFFWEELGAWAERTLREIHVLASAYGWGEADILALSPWRRHRYLEMVGG